MIDTEGPQVDDYVEFARAGMRVKGEFECAACGHRIVTSRALPECAGCGSGLWERATWSPFADLASRLRLRT